MPKPCVDFVNFFSKDRFDEGLVSRFDKIGECVCCCIRFVCETMMPKTFIDFVNFFLKLQIQKSFNLTSVLSLERKRPSETSFVRTLCVLLHRIACLNTRTRSVYPTLHIETGFYFVNSFDTKRTRQHALSLNMFRSLYSNKQGFTL